MIVNMFKENFEPTPDFASKTQNGVKNKLKLAILLTGRITNKPKYYENMIENLAQGRHEDVDFYICYQKNSNPEYIEYVKKKYNPIKIKENDEKFDHSLVNKDYATITPVDRPYNAMSSFRSRKLAMDMLKETSKKYDAIIWTRMDILFHSSVPYDLVLPKINQNILCFPDGKDFHGINDELVIGNEKTMEIYASVFDRAEDYLKTEKSKFNPEQLVLTHLNENKMEYYKFYLVVELVRNDDFSTGKVW